MALLRGNFLVLLFAHLCLSKSVTHNWDIAWRTAAPDGFPRPVIAVNGQWPPPILEADLGDTIIVNVHNSMRNETTSIHFHGQFQHGTNEMDGVADVTQCPIPPGGSFQYKFTAEPAGTHWWHSHDKAQYPDGIRGMMIVRDPAGEKELAFDKEFAFTVSDW
jgi:iron transport multicopper oxidase